MMRALRRRYGRAVGSIHERAARALGWPLQDVQSLSFHSLRELVRPVDPGLASEMTEAIQTSAYVTGKRRRRR